MLTSCVRCLSVLERDTEHLSTHSWIKASAWRQKCKAVAVLLCWSVTENKPAQTLEILSLLYSINTEMKACCATYRSCSEIYINIYIYTVYMGLLKETLKSVVGPCSSSVCREKCQISLKSRFHRVPQISEPNTALWNVGGRRWPVQGRITGLPNGYLHLFLTCSRLSSWPQKSGKGRNVYRVCF